MPLNRYFVYMMANKGRMLYIGVTGDLLRRVQEHKSGTGSAYTTKYGTHSLVWFDETNDVDAAINTEKQMKAWRRQWKLNVVEEKNPEWLDLADGWYG